MKKLLFILLAFVVTQCCLPQEIPLQIIYINENCEGVIPNYLADYFSVSDNCPNAVLTQIPEPGIILDIYQQDTTVVITAIDRFGLTDMVSFQVILVDTIPPEIHTLDLILTHSEQNIRDMYAAFEKWHTGDVEAFIEQFDWQAAGMDTLRIGENIR